MDNLLNQKQAAEFAGVNRRTIWYWIRYKGLPTVEVAGMKLIRPEDLEQFKPAKPGPKRTK